MGKPILHVKGLSFFIDGVYDYGIDCDIVANGQSSSALLCIVVQFAQWVST
ncbi:MAG: hypothetical protein KME56_06115 [Candidatus Thiodiazotropha sp. (ex Ctena orbiculata)]|nr:hypothetical protein [Candidatus Thiodiazotropha taylori]MBT2996188.1 hypothetical protein [Candidatus Thiodiazotropha taylori]MBT2999667.1 hypothetical protein [Candidatus Thiodiazotropha taylori]MBV2090584.1 hypothetical protein [Candidatus Thiodiazotropha taylori]MBV2106311.1 hypothetical protein [Candidatus Thiodiazotropha taylori]